MNLDATKLQCRNIFIDTQSFTQHNFIFEGTTLKRISELGKAAMISFILTDVVRDEVLKKMKERIDKLHANQKKHLNEIKFLHTELEDIPKLFDAPQMLTAAKSAWEKYLDNSSAKIISSDSVSVSEVLLRYFECTPPFSEGKKYEFPDAISLLCIEKWAEQNETLLYVVSGDPDLTAFCASSKSLIPIKSVSELLDIYNRTEQELTTKVHELVDKNIEYIINTMYTEFMEDCDVEWDFDPHENESEYTIDKIEVGKINVIEVDHKSAFISAKAHIFFSGSVTGYDWENYPQEYTVDLKSDDVFDVEMEIEFNESVDSIIATEGMNFNDGISILLTPK